MQRLRPTLVVLAAVLHSVGRVAPVAQALTENADSALRHSQLREPEDGPR